MNYTVIFETTPSGYSAYAPDLPGCVAAGKTKAEVERLIRSAIRSHLATLRALGELERMIGDGRATPAKRVWADIPPPMGLPPGRPLSEVLQEMRDEDPR